MQPTEEIRKQILAFQQTEITEYHIYSRLAKRIKSPENARLLEKISQDELRHYNEWKQHSGEGCPAAMAQSLVVLLRQPRVRVHVRRQTHGTRRGEGAKELRIRRGGHPRRGADSTRGRRTRGTVDRHVERGATRIRGLGRAWDSTTRSWNSPALSRD
jgi:hypothetical protein